jgi:hypothetical protein
MHVLVSSRLYGWDTNLGKESFRINYSSGVSNKGSKSFVQHFEQMTVIHD